MRFPRTPAYVLTVCAAVIGTAFALAPTSAAAPEVPRHVRCIH